jgi:nitrous oxide reductase accessory protein NosL
MKLKHGIFCLLALALLGIAAVVVAAGSDIDEFRSCSQCGMDRKAFGYSRMLVIYRDGGKTGVCSLHCAVADSTANKGKEIASLLVADRNSRELIAAEKAFWVMGGKKRGVMTALPKWAFAREQDANKFVKESGGKLTPFDQVMASAQKEVSEMAQ